MKKKYIIIAIVMIIAVASSLSLLMIKETKKEEVSVLEHTKAEALYPVNEVGSCTNIPNTYDDITLFLIFGQMKKDKLLKDSIDIDTFKKEANKIVNEIPNNINYIYEGYKYSLNGNKITREEASCPDKSYVTKLYGYSSGEDNIYLTIMSGYISNNKVYDLENNEIGEYEKDTLNKVLDKGTIKTYDYSKTKTLYKFDKAK